MNTANAQQMIFDLNLLMQSEDNKRDKNNMNENELIYPISINYGKKDWNIVAAIREFLSNMLDTKAKYSYSHDGKMAYITDTGKGLSKKDFIFGESTRDDSQIGQFGEGMKMSLIQLLRENRKVSIHTVGFSVEVRKIYSKIYDSEVMSLSFKENTRKIGTEIVVECTKKELQEAADLFLQLNDKVKRIDDNIYLPSGSIFILGLDTNKLPNTIFSYNIMDKSMSNRDRNIVAADKLQDNIIKIINSIKNVKAAKEFLSHIEKDTVKYEYQLPIYPDNIDVWKKALKSIYKTKVVVSSDLQCDINAKMMGYHVIRNIPYHVLQLLLYMGVERSCDVAKDYNGQGLFENNKIVYPISSDYCINWTIKDAIRELIANALDTGTNIRVEYHNGKGRIVDSGDGILMKHFIFGISQKGKDDIGQFGEGLKVSSLVLARNKREVTIQTAGYTYSPTIEKYKEFDTNLFTVYFKKNQRTKGTIIDFDCTNKELEEAKSLFSCFKKRKTKPIEMPDLEVYLDEPDKIYVNGLITQNLPTLFGYNIKDKSFVTSRDRNQIDYYRFTDIIIKFLSQTDNLNIINKILTSWKEKQHATEYRCYFNINDITPWQVAVKKIYKKACLPSFDDKDNFIAKQAGYEIIKNAPEVIESILKKSKIPNAKTIAIKHKDKGILFGNRIVYPISIDYCNNWTVKDAIRELLANSLDTESKVTVTHKNGITTISDKGEGISSKNFLFGNSAKDNNQIGQFGEGLKISMLVLARNNREVKIITKGYEYTAKIERDKEFSADVLVVYLNKSKKRIGTDIIFKCSESELSETKDLFIYFNKNITKIDENVYYPGGKIYVNGVYITDIDAMYSYDLSNAKKCLTRDRKAIEIEPVRDEIAKIISKITNPKYIKDFFEARLTYIFEMTVNIKLTASAKKAWSEVAQRIFPKSCLPSYTDHDLAAFDRGYTVLNGLTSSQISILEQLNFPRSNQVATLKGDEKVVKKRFNPRNLSEEGKKRWRRGLRLFKKLYGEERMKKIEIVKEFNYDAVNEDTLGYYNHENEGIYIYYKLVDDTNLYPFNKMMGVLIHEEIHHQSGADDRTREFENALTYELGRLADIFMK